MLLLGPPLALVAQHPDLLSVDPVGCCASRTLDISAKRRAEKSHRLDRCFKYFPRSSTIPPHYHHGFSWAAAHHFSLVMLSKRRCLPRLDLARHVRFQYSALLMATAAGSVFWRLPARGKGWFRRKSQRYWFAHPMVRSDHAFALSNNYTCLWHCYFSEGS